MKCLNLTSEEKSTLLGGKLFQMSTTRSDHNNTVDKSMSIICTVV